MTTDMKIQDRIQELIRVPASQLKPSPHNWRTHPDSQAKALRGSLDELGWYDAIIARRLDDGTLEVGAEGLVKRVLRDHRITKAALELVSPGESVRITSVRDVIEPRIKISGPGVCYPGLFGRPVVTVGQGRTHRLSGIAVIEVAEVEFYHGNDAWLDTAIDMSGPGAVAPYSKFPNICVVLDVDSSLTIEDQNSACNQAALLVSDALAAAKKRQAQSSSGQSSVSHDRRDCIRSRLTSTSCAESLDSIAFAKAARLS